MIEERSTNNAGKDEALQIIESNLVSTEAFDINNNEVVHMS